MVRLMLARTCGGVSVVLHKALNVEGPNKSQESDMIIPAFPRPNSPPLHHSIHRHARSEYDCDHGCNPKPCCMVGLFAAEKAVDFHGLNRPRTIDRVYSAMLDTMKKDGVVWGTVSQ